MCEDLKIIKKKYGEKMMQLCRYLFSTILDSHPGLLSQILLDSFEKRHDLYDDIVKRQLEISFKNYIYSIYEQLTSTKEEKKGYVEDPVTLMKRAGYTLYECENERDIQSFKKYYIQGEMLCTFTQGGRLRNCHVFFAVKDGADKLNRSDFTTPRRQDEYGTSVLSIQFTRDKNHTLSIKNRYNHSVKNPDATFSNNLDNIIKGLSQSFADYYGMKQSFVSTRAFELPGYVRASDGKFYKYNYEINNVYYCPNNVVIDNFQVFAYEREKYLVMDYFVLDLVNKRFITKIDDAFPETIGKIKNINIVNSGEEKKITITCEDGQDIIIILDKFQRIISFKNDYVTTIGDNFLKYNEVLNDLSLNNLEMIGNDFLFSNKMLREIKLPKVKEIANNFLFRGRITKIELPEVTNIGNDFMWENMHLRKISLPKTVSLGRDFLCSNFSLDELYAPMVREVGDNFLLQNSCLKELSLPEIITIKSHFCFHGKNIEKLYLPKVKTIGNHFLTYNQGVVNISMTEVLEIGNSFMRWNQSVKSLDLQNLRVLGQDALVNNKKIEEINAPNLQDEESKQVLRTLLDNNHSKKLILHK